MSTAGATCSGRSRSGAPRSAPRSQAGRSSGTSHRRPRLAVGLLRQHSRRGIALYVAFRYMAESRDEGAVRTDVGGLGTFSAALFLIVFGLLRGNSEGWSSALIVSTLLAGVAMLALFVLVELRQTRPMLDMSLFRQPAFVGVSLSTFALGAGMFAMFPYLSIYLQDVLGLSPLGGGLRLLPLTVFVFAVPITTRNIAQRTSAWLLAGSGVL